MTDRELRDFRIEIRNELPRLVARRQAIHAALEAAAPLLSESPRRVGMRLAAEFPELELVARAAVQPPDTLSLAAEEADVRPEGMHVLFEMERAVNANPLLRDAVLSAFGEVEVPVLTLLVGDPIVVGGRPRQPIPWQELSERLSTALRSANHAVRLDVAPATWQRAVESVPRSRFLVLLCHGEPGSLSFEEEGTLGEYRVNANDRVPSLFSGKKPQVVVVLACHAGEIAKAIYQAGVPVTVGINRDEELSYDEAYQIATAFVGALAGGQDVAAAVRVAVGATTRPKVFQVFGPSELSMPAWPSGELVAASLDPWLSERPTPLFTGRAGELAMVWTALRDRGRVVVVAGGPGTGKTEIARVILERCRLYRFPEGGTVFISLEGAGTASDIVRAGAVVQPGGERIEMSPSEVGRRLGAAERLVVFDNAEDALRGRDSKEAFEELIRACLASGQARVLVTSREDLPWNLGQQTVPVERLATSEETEAILLAAIAGPVGTTDPDRWNRYLNDSSRNDLVAAIDRYPLVATIAGALLRDGEPVSRVLEALLKRGTLDLPGLTAEEKGRLESLAASLDLSRVRLAQMRPDAVGLWRIIAELPAGLPDEATLEHEDLDDLRALRRLHLLEASWGGMRCLVPVRFYLREHARVDLDHERTRRIRSRVAQGLAAVLDRAASSLGTEAWQYGGRLSLTARLRTWPSLVPRSM